MAEVLRPLSKLHAPDPSTTYERANPQAEAGMGMLDNDPAVPSDHPDHMQHAVGHAQASKQLNADDIVNERCRECIGELPPAAGDDDVLEAAPAPLK